MKKLSIAFCTLMFCWFTWTLISIGFFWHYENSIKNYWVVDKQSKLYNTKGDTLRVTGMWQKGKYMYAQLENNDIYRTDGNEGGVWELCGGMINANPKHSNTD